MSTIGMIGMGLGGMESTVNFKLIRFHQTFIPASSGVVTRGCAQQSMKLSMVGLCKYLDG